MRDIKIRCFDKEVQKRDKKKREIKKSPKIKCENSRTEMQNTKGKRIFEKRICKERGRGRRAKKITGEMEGSNEGENRRKIG